MSYRLVIFLVFYMTVSHFFSSFSYTNKKKYGKYLLSLLQSSDDIKRKVGDKNSFYRLILNEIQIILIFTDIHSMLDV